MKIEIEPVGIEDFLQTMLKFKEEGVGQQTLDDAQALILNRIRTRFLQKVTPDYQPWIPSRSGLRREKMGHPGTLFKSGTLFHSIQAFQVNQFTRGIGTDVPYAVKHNEGLEGQVKREFLGLGTEDINLVYRLFIKRLDEALST